MSSVVDETKPEQLTLGAEGPAAGRKPLLALVDAHAIVHRGFHALVQSGIHFIARKTGENTTAVFGFTNILLKALADFKPTHIAVTFDTPTPTFRHAAFEQYKAQRVAAPPELRSAFPRVHQLMEAFNVPIYEMPGYEADDLLGTLARQAAEQDIDTVIVTGDTDMFQLISPKVKVALFLRVQERKVYGEAEIVARYEGLTPHQLIDFKALKGDPSDNIPGVPGIGEKTAVKLLQDYKTLDGVYENLAIVKPDRARKALEEHREQAYQGRELSRILTDVPVALDMEKSRWGSFDRTKVVDLLRDLEFQSLVDRVPGEPTVVRASSGGVAGATPLAPSVARAGQLALMPEDHDAGKTVATRAVEHVTVLTTEALESLATELRAAKSFTFDAESTDTDPMRGALVGLSFGTTPDHAWYVPIGHKGTQQLPWEQVRSVLGPLLENPSIPKAAHNANYDMTLLANYGVRVQGLAFDTMLAAHGLGRKTLGLKALALDVLNEEMTPISSLIGTGRKQITMDMVPVSEAAPYACNDSDVTMRLKERLEEEMRQDGFARFFSEVEIPLVWVLVDMQRRGMKLDVQVLRDLNEKLTEQLTRSEREVYEAVGHQFNIGSPKQLSDILFGELGLPKSRKTATGAFTTDASTLEELKDAHPVIPRLIEYRQVSKLKSTYIDTLPQQVNPRTGRVHTSFNQAGAATGRLASNEPNLMNIPVRTELGKQIRKAFIAEKPGWTLLSADYSQIELRVLAHLSKDENLVAAFLNGEDIHKATASLMFNVPTTQVTGDHRRIAKILNFGVVYGLSPFGISQQTGFTPDEGQKFIKTYFEKYPGIERFIEETKANTRKTGYVETLLKRRRYVPEAQSSNYQVRSAADRMVINYPVQGTAAEIMKIAMVRIHRRLEEEGRQGMLLLQVHDELIFELPEDELATLTALIQDEMPRALPLVVPLRVDIKVARAWGDME